MTTRNAVLILALLAASCSTKNYNSAIVISKLVEGTAAGTPAVCVFDPGTRETDFANVDPTLGSGMMGVIIVNQLSNPSAINSVLRNDSTLFAPHQVVASYEVIGGQTVANQIIPVSGGSIGSGGTISVLTPFFSPAGVRTLTGTVRVTFHVEGKLQDGSTVHSSEHEYIFVTCNTPNCSDTCM